MQGMVPFMNGKIPTREIEKQISVLFTAPVLLCKSFAPLMESEKKGTIINITSLATLYPLPYMPFTTPVNLPCLPSHNQ